MTGFVCTDNPELLEAPEPVQVEGIEPWTYPPDARSIWGDVAVEAPDPPIAYLEIASQTGDEVLASIRAWATAEKAWLYPEAALGWDDFDGIEGDG